MMNRNGARQKGKMYPSGESVIFRVENRDAILACARFIRKRDNLHGELLKRGRCVSRNPKRFIAFDTKGKEKEKKKRRKKHGIKPVKYYVSRVDGMERQRTANRI